MSFIHNTYVGHFDPTTVSPHKLRVARPIDPERVARLLAEYPALVAGQIALRDGYACCQWAPAPGPAGEVIEFAYRLARMEQCLAVEQGQRVTYPLPAARAQGEALGQGADRARLAVELELQAQAQCDLLRDIVGGPSRTGPFPPDWRTGTAVAMAQQMYEAREFSAMPILADALQDAGCDDDEILDHCRESEPHVRGCWVVDLLLGKG